MEQGRGRSKKQAKRIAAFKVNKTLTEMVKGGMDSLDSKNNDDVGSSIVEQLQELTLTTTKKQPTKFNLLNWCAQLQERSGEKLSSIMVIKKYISSVLFCNNI
jgi:hypothetical protein